jgi:hypothetical protein
MSVSEETNPKRPRVHPVWIIIGILVLVVAGGLLIFSADLQFGIFDTIGEDDNAVVVEGTPERSKVYIDDEYVGKTPLELQVRTGSVIRIEHEGYRPMEFIIKQVVDNRITYSLALIPSLEEIDYQVSDFVVRPNGDIDYLKVNKFLRWDNIEEDQTEISEIALIPSTVSFSANTEEVLLVSVGTYVSNLEYLETVTAGSITITDSLLAFTWGPGTGQFTVISFGDDEELSFEIYEGDDRVAGLFFERPHEIVSLAWCAGGSSLIVQGEAVFSIFAYDGDELDETAASRPGYFPMCSPVDGNQVVYIDAELNLNLMDAEGESSRVISQNAAYPYIWRPDGGAIIFARYNPDEGRSSFWQVDVDTKNKTLLVDSSIVWGKVAEFQMAEDQRYIAYLSDTDHLYLITLAD